MKVGLLIQSMIARAPRPNFFRINDKHYQRHYDVNWNENAKSLLLAAPEVVKMTISSVASGENFMKIITSVSISGVIE